MNVMLVLPVQRVFSDVLEQAPGTLLGQRAIKVAHVKMHFF